MRDMHMMLLSIVNFESIGAGKPVLFLLYRETYGISKVPNEV
jgi:hypothetical protein